LASQTFVGSKQRGNSHTNNRESLGQRGLAEYTPGHEKIEDPERQGSANWSADRRTVD